MMTASWGLTPCSTTREEDRLMDRLVVCKGVVLVLVLVLVIGEVELCKVDVEGEGKESHHVDVGGEVKEYH